MYKHKNILDALQYLSLRNFKVCTLVIDLLYEKKNVKIILIKKGLLNIVKTAQEKLC